MAFAKKTVRDVDVNGKTVLVRAMLNVPIENGEVGDKMRLKAALPTLQFLLEHGAALVLMSHHSHEGQSLAPVAPVLSDLLGTPIQFVPDCIGEQATAAVKQLQPGQIIMLENLRFHPEEEANDDGFARQLASYGQVYVNDDFTTCHREHASLVSVPKYLPAVAGLEVELEVDTITSALQNPKRPMVAVTAGAKISTKIPIMSFLLDTVDALFVGGAMANTFLAAQGKGVGKSLSEQDQIETAKQILSSAAKQNKTVLLPVDVVVTKDIKSAADVRTVRVDEVAADDIIADLGPQSVNQLSSIIKSEGSVIWNGPVGIAEQPVFAAGTKSVAEAIIASGAFSLIGGGDTADYVDGAGLADKFSFVSTGGGASLELMAGKPLPGVEALLDK
jgi:phosphoglycerate kinase